MGIEYKSLNRETGLLEDIDEVRDLVVQVAETVEAFITNPVIAMMLSDGLRLDLAAMVVTACSVVQPMSQASYLRELGRVLGMQRDEIEQQVRMSGASETYPNTHPAASRFADRLPPLNPNDPVVRGSQVLSSLANSRAQEKIELPPNIDEFLKELFKEE